MTKLTDGITWFRGSSVRIRRGGRELHVDPIGVHEESAADIVLLTHPHYDNFSEEDIARVQGEETVVIAPSRMKKLLEDGDHFMRPGDMLHLDAFEILAVPAHNVHKRFHPPDQGWLGYVFTFDDVTYYHAGDTDFLPSMFGIRCDVAFLPCGGHYTMGPDDAARAAEACGASVVVPIHWGDPHGTREEVEGIADHYSGEIHILPRSG